MATGAVGGLLHKAIYVVAAALMAHVLLIGDIGPGFVMIALGFLARIPAVKRWIQQRADHRRGIACPRSLASTLVPER